MPRIPVNSALPTFDQFLRPLIVALKQLGGSGTIEEINRRVFENLKLSDDILQVPHGSDSARTEVEYRIAWTRTYLKRVGLIINSERGVWSLVDPNTDPDKVESAKIVKQAKEMLPQPSGKRKPPKKAEEQEDDQEWKEALLRILGKVPPAAFERLAQRVLRESGFVQVEVTGKTGDGGIDGKGIIRLSGVLSFHVIFQCKRYKRAVPPKDIRDFRGAMTGRADKGLFITTSSFTREAIREATRDGAPAIDLIDGETLCDKLKELNLGVHTHQVPKVAINMDWFSKL